MNSISEQKYYLPYPCNVPIGDCGYIENPLTESVSISSYHTWITEKGHSPLKYLENSLPRQDLREFFPQFKSGLVFLFPYNQFRITVDNFYQQSGPLQMAAYVLAFEGYDYHYFLKRKLSSLADKISFKYPGIEYAISLDTSPLLEKDLAYRAGLGWFGRNSLLINPKLGSSLIIGSILFSEKINKILEEEELANLLSLGHLGSLSNFKDHSYRVPDNCGNCQACVTACPSKAIHPHTRTIKISKCISASTNYPAHIKLNEVPRNSILGCDICQRVCPWNKLPANTVSTGEIDSTDYQETRNEYFLKYLEAYPLLNNLFKFFFYRSPAEVLADLQRMSNREFARVFAGSSLVRIGRKGILTNLASVSNSSFKKL